MKEILMGPGNRVHINVHISGLFIMRGFTILIRMHCIVLRLLSSKAQRCKDF